MAALNGKLSPFLWQKLGGITIYVKHSEATKATLLWDGVRLKDFLIATKNASPHSIQK